VEAVQGESERDYKKSLYVYLSTELAGVKVTPEFGRDRARSDIVVADKVIIELKHNLTIVSAYVDADLMKRLVDWANKPGPRAKGALPISFLDDR
jgi:hypothetical protein